MQRQTTRAGTHAGRAETWLVPRHDRRGDADLFNLDHYPVHATCRLCAEPIRADSFLHAFKHED